MSQSLDTQKEAMSTSNHIENGRDVEIDPDAERALLRKIDYRLIPCVWFMYLLSYVSNFPLFKHVKESPKSIIVMSRDHGLRLSDID